MVLPPAYVAIGPHKAADCWFKEHNRQFSLSKSVVAVIV